MSNYVWPNIITHVKGYLSFYNMINKLSYSKLITIKDFTYLMVIQGHTSVIFNSITVSGPVLWVEKPGLELPMTPLVAGSWVITLPWCANQQITEGSE